MFLSLSGRARPIFPSSNPRPLIGVTGEPPHLQHLSLTRPLAFSLWPGNRPMAVGPWPGSRAMAVWLREGNRPMAARLREGSRLTAAVTTMSPEVPACWKAIGHGHRIHGVSSEYGTGGEEEGLYKHLRKVRRKREEWKRHEYTSVVDPHWFQMRIRIQHFPSMRIWIQFWIRIQRFDEQKL
jgi:hypothetical protein